MSQLSSYDSTLVRTHTLTREALVRVPASDYVDVALLLPDDEVVQTVFDGEPTPPLWQALMWNRRDAWLPIGKRRGAMAAWRSSIGGRL